MESSGANKVVLGVVGAVGVVFISYLLFKNFGSPANGKRSHKRKASYQGLKKTSSFKQNTKSVESATEEGTSKKPLEEDPNQTSFILLDAAVDNQPVSSRKSDRSSDESSYDVVEADDVVDEKLGKSARERELEESLLDEMDASAVEASSSSFYHSAEDTWFRDVKEKSASVVSNDESVNEEFQSEALTQSQAKSAQAESDREESRVDQQSISSTDTVIQSKSLDIKSASASGDVDSPASKYTTTASIKLNKEAPGINVDAKPKLATISTVVARPEGGEGSTDVDVPSEASSLSVQQKNACKVEDRELGADEVTSTLTACQNTPMAVTKDQIDILVLLLQKNNPTLQPTVLDSLVRVSAFTQNNQAHLRNAGCESVVCQQVSEKCKAILSNGLEDDTLLVAQTKVLTNLSMDPKVIPNLEGCVSPLIDILIQPSAPESLQLSILRPLINLCSQDNFHAYYTPAIQRLYALLDEGSYNIQLQSVKVLVNLSLNETMVPNMLSAKAPDSLLDLLDKPTHADVILRVLTMIGNLKAAIATLNIDHSSLPSANKAESPKTMYTSLCGVVKAPLLRNKVYRLTRHSEEDIRLQASKLYTLITVVKK